MTGARKAGGVQRRWWIAIALALLAAVGTYLVVASRAGGFDAELWQAQRGSNERRNPRAGMVGDLLREHLRVGMSRAEVLRLLGEPDYRDRLSDVYELGVSPVGVDDEYLVVDYDDTGRVKHLSIRQG